MKYLQKVVCGFKGKKKLNDLPATLAQIVSRKPVGNIHMMECRPHGITAHRPPTLQMHMPSCYGGHACFGILISFESSSYHDLTRIPRINGEVCVFLLAFFVMRTCFCHLHASIRAGDSHPF
jgi:hypothetical protein